MRVSWGALLCAAAMLVLLRVPACGQVPRTFDLRLRVVGRDEVPAAGLALLVRPAEADTGSAPGYDESERRGTTDSDGFLEIRGLPCVPYVVRACTDRWDRRYSWLLTSEPVRPETGEADEVRLTFSRPHVVVRLRDAEGEPWNGPGGDLREYAFAPREWPDGPRVYLFACAPVEGTRGSVGQLVPGVRTAHDEFVFERRDATSYLVGALGGGALGGSFEAAPLAIELPPDGDRVLVELRNTSLRPMGAVVVHVLAAGGESDNFSVQLQSLPGGVGVVGTSSLSDALPFVLRAPPGDYRVVAQGFPLFEPYHHGLMVPRALGRTEAAVRVEPGGVADVELRLEEGGDLEVTPGRG